MRLLIYTQRVDKDDENLGSFHAWIREFAMHFDDVLVIAGRVGTYDLPANVRIYSFRRRPNAGILSRLTNFFFLTARLFPEADAIFYHMIPEFVVATLPWLLFSHAKTGLWYTHKSVTWRLRIAESAVDAVFTPVATSFGLPSSKVMVTGHAIDTARFSPGPARSPGHAIVTSGRITPVKRIEVMLEAMRELKNTSWRLDIVGASFVERDKAYEARLRALVDSYGLSAQVSFLGKRPFGAMPDLLSLHDVFLSFTDTGSLDKAALEAMASGLKLLTVNQAFKGKIPDRYLVSYDPKTIAAALGAIEAEPYPVRELREYVAREHDLRRTIALIAERLKNRSHA